MGQLPSKLKLSQNRLKSVGKKDEKYFTKFERENEEFGKMKKKKKKQNWFVLRKRHKQDAFYERDEEAR